METPATVVAEALRGYVEYLRDLGVYDLYRRGEPGADLALSEWVEAAMTPKSSIPPGQRNADAGAALPVPPRSMPPAASPFEQAQRRMGEQVPVSAQRPAASPRSPNIETASTFDLPGRASGAGMLTPEMSRPIPFNQLAPLPTSRVAAVDRPAALKALQAEIGDCTRCPLAYAGRHTVVFGDGDPVARLMFVGEGPGADEDASGVPFVGKAGQLLNNMIAAMGLQRSAVYIANIVKCRPPRNRQPEPVEANTCSPFLLRQIDIVQPEVIVALGATAATYLLGVRQSLASLRGRWFDVRGSRCAVTYHPAFLLRDPRQKGEAWKDLQRVMAEMKLTPPARPQR